jgi:hypothetical protein
MPVVAVFAVVAVALGVLLLAYAAQPFIRALVGALSGLPLGIGSWVARSEISMLNGFFNAVNAWVGASVGAAADLVHVVTWYQWQLFDKLAAIDQATLTSLQRIVGHTIPAAFNRAISFTIDSVRAAVHYTEALYNLAIGYSNARFQAAIAYTQAVGAQELAFAEARFAQAVAFAQALNAQALAFDQALFAQEIAYAQALHAQETRYAQALNASALGFAEDAFGKAIDYERQLYGQAIDYAGRIGAQDRDYARAIGAQAIGYAAAAAGAVAASVVALENQPCIRFCGPLGDLGQLLQGLEDMGLAALLLGLAGEAIHDPHGTQRTIDQLVGAPMREIARVTAGEIGLRVA